MRKYAKAVVNLLIALVVLLLIIFLAPRLIFFFMPFVVGWLIALIASPLVVFFEQKLKVRRQFGGVVVIVTVLALIVFLLYLGGAFLVDQASNLIENVPEMWNGFKGDMAEMATVIDTYLAKLPGTHKWSLNELGTQLGDALTGIFGKISTPTIEAAGNFAKSLPSIFIGVIMALLSSYLFVADRKTINEWFTKHTPAVVQLKYKTIRGSLVRRLLQGPVQDRDLDLFADRSRSGSASCTVLRADRHRNCFSGFSALLWKRSGIASLGGGADLYR